MLTCTITFVWFEIDRELHLLLQGVFLLLVHLDHDLILLLQNGELVLDVTLLAFERRYCVFQHLVLFWIVDKARCHPSTSLHAQSESFRDPCTFQLLPALLFIQQLAHEAIPLLLYHRQGGFHLTNKHTFYFLNLFCSHLSSSGHNICHECKFCVLPLFTSSEGIVFQPHDRWIISRPQIIFRTALIFLSKDGMQAATVLRRGPSEPNINRIPKHKTNLKRHFLPVWD